MELDVIDYIRNAIPEMSDDIYPIFTVDLKKPTLVYFFRPFHRDYVSESQLELRVIAKDYDTVIGIVEKLDAVLAFKRDEAYKIYGKTKFRSVKSGGGCLFHEGSQCYEYTLLYTLRWRYING